jgi:hypothetical protein
MMSKSSSLDKHRTSGDELSITMRSNVAPSVMIKSSPLNRTLYRWWKALHLVRGTGGDDHFVTKRSYAKPSAMMRSS